jgi:hypothetical protein
MSEEKPTDFIPPDIRDQNTGARRFSNDKIKNLTKIKLQDYVESFFKRDGVNHDLLSAVSPRFIHYNTDKSFDPATDPTERRMQIARYFAELRNVLPSILVVDGGIIGVPSNLGLISRTTLCNGVWRGFYPIFRRVPIAIVAAARDVDEADEMSGVLSLMFNELRNLACGHHLSGKREDAENWVITLPNAPVEVGSLTDTDVPGDPIQKIWYTETILDVFYEDQLSIQATLPLPKFGGDRVNEPNLKGTLAPVIEISDTVAINEQHQIVIRNWQDHYRVVLSNGRIATISLGLLLTPRGFGKVSIRVIDPNDAGTAIAEKEIEVV